jgi:hypothetical protein
MEGSDAHSFYFYLGGYARPVTAVREREEEAA